MENITKKENKFPHDYDINNLISVRFADFVINVTKRYKEHYIENEYEKFSSDLFLNYIKEDSTVVDVGANYGYYSLLAATKNKSGVVYSFEPVKENFDVLNKNIKENDFLNVKTFNLAISDDSGEKNFNVTEASDSSGFYEHPNTEILEKRIVKAVSLDDFFGDVKIDVIKIDTEGHELFVLNGMEKVIKNNEDIKLLIEFNPKCLKNANTDPADFLKRISKLGFIIIIIKENEKKLIKLPENVCLWKNSLNENDYCNLLCIRKNNAFLESFLLESSGSYENENVLLKKSVDQLKQDIEVCDKSILQKKQEIEFIKSSKFWKLREKYIKLKNKIRND